MNLLINAVKVFWFLLPAGLANTGAMLSVRLFPKLNYPIDFGKKFRGKRIFGAHKTWRGLIFGMLMSFIVFSVQKYIINHTPALQEYSLINYSNICTDFIGAYMGLGALFGDMVKSFFKRQIEVGPGKDWVPFDQVDWMLGTVLFIYPFIDLNWDILLGTIVLMVIYSIIVVVFRLTEAGKKGMYSDENR